MARANNTKKNREPVSCNCGAVILNHTDAGYVIRRTKSFTTLSPIISSHRHQLVVSPPTDQHSSLVPLVLIAPVWTRGWQHAKSVDCGSRSPTEHGVTFSVRFGAPEQRTTLSHEMQFRCLIHHVVEGLLRSGMSPWLHRLFSSRPRSFHRPCQPSGPIRATWFNAGAIGLGIEASHSSSLCRRR